MVYEGVFGRPCFVYQRDFALPYRPWRSEVASSRGTKLSQGQHRCASGPDKRLRVVAGEREVGLSKECKKGMEIATNSASFEVSRRAISQAEKIERLTLLAFFFVPLTSICSFSA